MEIKNTEPETEVTKTDVLVVTVGLTGCIVAIEACRHNVMTALFEKVAVRHGMEPHHSRLILPEHGISRVPSYQKHTKEVKQKNG